MQETEKEVPRAESERETQDWSDIESTSQQSRSNLAAEAADLQSLASASSVSSEKSSDTKSSGELVFDDPFKSAAAKTGEGPRLGTALPGPLPQRENEKGKSEIDAGKQGGQNEAVLVIAPALVEEAKLSPSEAEQSGFKRPEAGELTKSAETRMQDLQKFSSWLNKNFDSLDSNSDGSLTKTEVSEAVVDKIKANGESAPYLNALYNSIDFLSSEFSGENSKGLAKSGLGKLESLSKDSDFFQKGDRALQVKDLGKVMSHLDTDRNGSLSPKETEEALKRQDVTREQSQALSDLQAYQKHLLTKDYGATQKDENGEDLIFKDLGGAVMMTPRSQMANLGRSDLALYASNMERLTDGISQNMRHASDRLDAAARDPDRISQGTDGSCFFLTPLSGLKDQDPKVMEKMIKDNGDGTHTVSFPGAPDKPITVNTPTDTEMSNWANGKNAAILEKAFSEYYTKNMIKKDELNSEQLEKIESPVQSARILGGNTAEAIKLLTGKEAAQLELDQKSDDELRTLFTELAKNNTPIAADTPYYRLNQDLVSSHSYKMKYDPATDSVTLENPVKPGKANENTSSYPYEPFKIDRGAKDGLDDGKFKMSLADFKKYFFRVSYPEN